MLCVVNTFQSSAVISLVMPATRNHTLTTVGGRIYTNSPVAKCHFIKNNKPEYELLFLFLFFHVCLQGEVVEFLDEFLEEEDEPQLESPPKP